MSRTNSLSLIPVDLAPCFMPTPAKWTQVPWTGRTVVDH